MWLSKDCSTCNLYNNRRRENFKIFKNFDTSSTKQQFLVSIAKKKNTLTLCCKKANLKPWTHPSASIAQNLVGQRCQNHSFLQQVSNFYFLEQRRRTARHFIKVERVHWSRKTTLGAWKGTAQTFTDIYIYTRETTKRPQALSHEKQRPGHQLLEFGSPCRAPKASFQANRPKDILYTWPLLLKNTNITMFPYLPCHQDY